jgi:hypothetical protein
MIIWHLEKINHNNDGPNVLSRFTTKLFVRSTRSVRNDSNFTDWNSFPIGGFYWEEHESQNNKIEYDYETKH